MNTGQQTNTKGLPQLAASFISGGRGNDKLELLLTAETVNNLAFVSLSIRRTFGHLQNQVASCSKRNGPGELDRDRNARAPVLGDLTQAA
jgi:hypothetical protein